MLIQELLDAAYHYELVKDDDGDVGDIAALFKDDTGTVVIVNATWWPIPKCYELEFKRKNSYEMTNDSPAEKHQAMRILATVVKIIRKIVQDEKPPFLCFSSAKNEKSRVSLYDTMVKRLASSLGYVDVTSTPERIKHDAMADWMEKRLAKEASYKQVYLASKEFLKT